MRGLPGYSTAHEDISVLVVMVLRFFRLAAIDGEAEHRRFLGHNAAQ